MRGYVLNDNVTYSLLINWIMTHYIETSINARYTGELSADDAVIINWWGERGERRAYNTAPHYCQSPAKPGQMISTDLPASRQVDGYILWNSRRKARLKWFTIVLMISAAKWFYDLDLPESSGRWLSLSSGTRDEKLDLPASRQVDGYILWNSRRKARLVLIDFKVVKQCTQTVSCWLVI